MPDMQDHAPDTQDRALTMQDLMSDMIWPPLFGSLLLGILQFLRR